jgi:hypothetical protein
MYLSANYFDYFCTAYIYQIHTKMKNTVLILLIGWALFSNILSVAQNVKVSGKVFDEKSDAVIAATVSLISKDSALISGTITDHHGNFELTTPRNTAFCLLRITHIEFENVFIPVVPDKDTTITTFLKERSYLLNEVQVIARKPIYEYKNGNLIVNIGENSRIQTFSAARLLRTLPGVTDSDGTLTLNGRPAIIYLDGKKQTMSPSQLNTFIQSMPVATIDKIELIYSSGGIYDASDGAIINIIYKKQRVDGYYLSIGGNAAAYDKNHLDGGSFATIMFKKKNVMLNSMLSYRNNYSTIQTKDTLLYWNDAVISQSKHSENRMNVYMGMLNLSWDFKKGHNLNFNFNFYDDFSNHTSTQQYSLQQDDITRNVWNVKSKGNDDMWSGQIEYTSPDTLNNKIKASYGIIYGGLRNHRHTFDEGLEILYTDDEMLAHRHTVKMDYEHKFSEKISLLLGLKTDLGRLNDEMIYTETIRSERYPTSHFYGEENIYAGYGQLKYKPAENWSVNATLRAEHTYYYLDFKSQNEKVTDSYTNLFPFFTVSYNHKNRSYITALSFGSSIQRPDYNYMLPGIRYSDQYTYTKGNPALKPQISRMKIQWQNIFYQFINTYLGYEWGADLIGPVIKNSSIDPLIIEYDQQNIADYNHAYAGATVSYQILQDKVSGQIGGQIQHVKFRNPRNGYEFPQGKDNYWRETVNASCNYQITKPFGIHCEYYFYPKCNNLFSIMHTRWLMNVGAYYNSPKDNWSLSLDVNDIFYTNKTFWERYFGGNYNKVHSTRSSQYVQLSFIYKFKGGEKIEDKAKSGSLKTDRFSTK